MSHLHPQPCSWRHLQEGQARALWAQDKAALVLRFLFSPRYEGDHLMATITNFPGDPRHSSGDLARAVTHEADDTWPTLIEIVAYFGSKDQPRKGRRVSVEIN